MPVAGRPGWGPGLGCHSAEIPAGGPMGGSGIGCHWAYACTGPPKPGPSHGYHCHWQHRAQNLNFKLKLPVPLAVAAPDSDSDDHWHALLVSLRARSAGRVPPGGLVNWPLSGSVDSLSRPTGKSVAKRSSACPDAPLQTRPFKFKFELPATEWEVMTGQPMENLVIARTALASGQYIYQAIGGMCRA